MIGHLAGTVSAVRPGYAIISAGGVGYKVFATRELLLTLSAGGGSASGGKLETEVSVWTHLAVRESILDLYGFVSEEELRLFELLLTVSGIGPKSALAILDIASVETLRSAISAGNASYLTKVSGIGKKTAEKIVLELRDKVGGEVAGSAASLHGDEEALEAMSALGDSQGETSDALRKVPQEIERSNDRLRAALKIVGGK